MVSESRTADLPAVERFAYWHDMTAKALVPTAITSDHEDDFQAAFTALDLGGVQVSALTYPSLETRRTPKLIARSDPELYQVALTLRGRQFLTQVRQDTALGSHDLVLYDSSRPFHGRVHADDGRTVAAIVAQIPRALFPLPPDKADRLLARRIPGRDGIGALLTQFLTRLVTDARRYAPSDATSLETVLVDLVAALLAHELDDAASLPLQTHQRALALRIQAFIHQRLSEQHLSPATIAAAHHISTRHLHRLFQSQGITVAGWIRAQRLDRIRRDLADPALRLIPVRELAGRWGFIHPTAFSRAFRAAYGLAPGEYRRHRWGAMARSVKEGGALGQ